MYTVVVILAAVLCSFNFYYAIRFAIDGFNLDQGYEDFIIGFYKSMTMRWINSAIFTVAQIFMSLLIMCLLRVRFAYFYKEYGCFLWTVVTIQTLSQLI